MAKRNAPKRRPPPEAIRTGAGQAAIKQSFVDNLFYQLARFPEIASPHDNFRAFAYTVRDRLLARWIATARAYKQRHSRTVCYLSAEFLLGPLLGANLVNLDLEEESRAALAELGLDLDAYRGRLVRVAHHDLSHVLLDFVESAQEHLPRLDAGRVDVLAANRGQRLVNCHQLGQVVGGSTLARRRDRVCDFQPPP